MRLRLKAFSLVMLFHLGEKDEEEEKEESRGAPVGCQPTRASTILVTMKFLMTTNCIDNVAIIAPNHD